jgi:hypothetical protein
MARPSPATRCSTAQGQSDSLYIGIVVRVQSGATASGDTQNPSFTDGRREAGVDGELVDRGIGRVVGLIGQPLNVVGDGPCEHDD